MKNEQIKNKNSFKASVLIFLGLLMASATLYGQTSTPSQSSSPGRAEREYCPHQFSLWGAGGLSTLMYSPTVGERSSMFGGTFGLGYTFYFHRNFGILAGAELAFYNSKMKFDRLHDSYPAMDGDGQSIDYNTEVRDYEERQRMSSINIPLMLQYQSGGEHKFYASLGFKLGIPVYGKSKVPQKTSFTASGYYHGDGQGHLQELYDQRDLGYGTFTGNTVEEDIDFGLSYIGAVEAGVKWKLNDVLSLYTGAYFEYGFNDLMDKHDGKLAGFNRMNPGELEVNSALSSQYTRDGRTESFTDHVSPMAVGLKVRLGVDLCSNREKAVKETLEIAVVKEEVKKDTVVEPVKQAPQQEVQQQSRARARAILASRPAEVEEAVVEEKPVKLAATEKKEAEVDLKRAESEYRNVKGMVTIELEGYELDQATLSPKMETVLEAKIAEIRRTYGDDIRIVCEGHTCNVGKTQYNIQLGLKRAQVVREYLINKGDYKASRVEAVSKGPESPIAANDTEENRKKNRRVILVIRELE
jgi:outer membrane protein OmpA-like peptidoglycan-associated protein